MRSKQFFPISVGAATAVLCITLGMLLVSSAQASDIYEQGANKCSLKSLKGNWVFEEQGLIQEGDKNVPWVAAGIWSFDGAGNIGGLYSAGINGQAIDRQKPFTGTYELKSGCAFSSVDSLGIVYDIYVLDPGTTATYFAGGVTGTLTRR